MRLLFVKQSLGWPRASGHDVHTSHMMQACARLGHDVALATATAPGARAVEGLGLASLVSLADHSFNGSGSSALTPLQERFRSYWGVDQGAIAALAHHVGDARPDAVVAVGLEALPYLAAVPSTSVRIWYAADEWVLHHLSLARVSSPTTWTHLRAAVIKGFYERVYAPIVDRAWVVSDSEARAMRWLAGVSTVDVVPNGVDTDHYSPLTVPELPNSAVFWGRLDFAPNVQALEWFCHRVWPAIRAQMPDARFTIIGFHPLDDVRALAELPGVTLRPDLPDLRDEAARHAVVVLPFVSGGGIKNKLLEAAALGKPIVCTPRARGGLCAPAAAGLIAATRASEWVREIVTLWTDAERRRALGAAGRLWVTEHHSWAAAAGEAMRALAAHRERAA